MARRTMRQIALGLASVVILALVGPCRFNYFRVCPVCGRLEHVSERQLPFMPVRYWRSRSVEETRLSRVASDDRLVIPHDHPWLFGAGSGNGVMCAIGEGRHLPDILQSRQVASFVHCVAAYRSKDEAGQWLRLTLDTHTQNRMRFALTVTDFPDQGFTDRDKFDTWWTAHKDDLATYSSPPGQ